MDAVLEVEVLSGSGFEVEVNRNCIIGSLIRGRSARQVLSSMNYPAASSGYGHWLDSNQRLLIPLRGNDERGKLRG
jgi:hypothetical protein